MASVMFSIPDEAKESMHKFPWVNWSELAREEIFRRRRALVKFNELLKHSELSDEDVKELSRKSRAGRFKELQSKGLV